jgi:mono/diheme cytochrome c family protein
MTACGDDDGDDDGTADAAPQADAAVADAAAADAGLDPVLARGEYLVNAVAVCGDCHTPRIGITPDETRFLAGSPTFVDIMPGVDGMGLIPSKNLTPDPETGLGDWTDEEIKNAFLNGVDIDGEPLFGIMPYYVLHNMSDADADAIVAYLRSIPAVEQEIPEREELGFPVVTADPVPAAMIPDTTLEASDEDYDAAVQGKYLAGNIGICMECHTAATKGEPIPIDVTALFAGGRVFVSEQLGVPVPPFPDEIVSRNITPDKTGIQGFTAEQVRTVLKQGTDDDGDGICPPMPSGPMGAFANLTDEDALAIGVYITTIAPVKNAIKSDCTPPPL